MCVATKGLIPLWSWPLWLGRGVSPSRRSSLRTSRRVGPVCRRSACARERKHRGDGLTSLAQRPEGDPVRGGGGGVPEEGASDTHHVTVAHFSGSVLTGPLDSLLTAEKGNCAPGPSFRGVNASTVTSLTTAKPEAEDGWRMDRYKKGPGWSRHVGNYCAHKFGQVTWARQRLAAHGGPYVQRVWPFIYAGNCLGYYALLAS